MTDTGHPPGPQPIHFLKPRLSETHENRLSINLRGNEPFERVMLWVGNFIVTVSQEDDGGVDINVNDYTELRLRGDYNDTPTISLETLEKPFNFEYDDSQNVVQESTLDQESESVSEGVLEITTEGSDDIYIVNIDIDDDLPERVFKRSQTPKVGGTSHHPDANGIEFTIPLSEETSFIVTASLCNHAIYGDLSLSWPGAFSERNENGFLKVKDVDWEAMELTLVDA